MWRDAAWQNPSGWKSFRLRDSAGEEIPYQFASGAPGEADAEITFIADDVPSVGYRTYHLEARGFAGPGRGRRD